MAINLFWIFTFFFGFGQCLDKDREIKLLLNTKESDCPIMVGIYASEKDFIEKKSTLASFEFDPGLKDTLILIPKNVSEIAIAAFEDCNKNNKLDKNILGIPQESYAISNNASSKWQEPTFEEARINMVEVEEIQIDFEYWKNR